MTWGKDWIANDEVTYMALVGRRDGRNFGYDRQFSYAGPRALKDIFGDHLSTVKAHYGQWRAFVKWCHSEQGLGISDAQRIDWKASADYAAYLRDVVRCGDLAVSTAHYCISFEYTLLSQRLSHHLLIISCHIAPTNSFRSSVFIRR